MDRMEIKKSYLSLFGIFLWSWVLLFVPLIVRLLQIKSRIYAYDHRNIYISEGVFNKVSTTIPLYKIENIRAHSNVLGNGTLLLSADIRGSKEAGMNNLEFIKDVHHYQRLLTALVDAARDAKGVKPVDIF